MKETTNNQTGPECAGQVNPARACGKFILSQINRVKAAIFAQSAKELAASRHALQLALNEAEALAWQTMYPHLVFPNLAAEKIQAVTDWNSRQRELRFGRLPLKAARGV